MINQIKKKTAFADGETKVLKFRALIAAIAGAILGGVSEFSAPDLASQGGLPRPTLGDIPWQLMQLAGRFEVVLAFSVTFALIAVFRYRRRDAWVFAFLAGTSSAHIILHIFRGVFK